MIWIWLLPAALQGLAIISDEVFFHRRRDLPNWEKIGHPIDSLVFLACISIPFLTPLNMKSLKMYSFLACLSCFVITKDEWVHSNHCSPEEHWVHSVLFILHPIILIETLLLWLTLTKGSDLIIALIHLEIPWLTTEEAKWVLAIQCAGAGIFMIYQIISGFLSLKVQREIL